MIWWNFTLERNDEDTREVTEETRVDLKKRKRKGQKNSKWLIKGIKKTRNTMWRSQILYVHHQLLAETGNWKSEREAQCRDHRFYTYIINYSIKHSLNWNEQTSILIIILSDLKCCISTAFQYERSSFHWFITFFFVYI